MVNARDRISTVRCVIVNVCMSCFFCFLVRRDDLVNVGGVSGSAGVFLFYFSFSKFFDIFLLFKKNSNHSGEPVFLFFLFPGFFFRFLFR